MNYFGDIQKNLETAANNMPHFTSIDIAGILNWVYGISGIVAVGFIVYGAIMYATAQGNADTIKQATKSLIYAVVGLVVVLLAAAITNFVASSV
jgi:hypothetical protein